MKEYVLGFLLVIIQTVTMMAVENLTKDKTLMFISDETGITQYCEFGPLSSVTSTKTNGELSPQCYQKNKNMRHILPDGTVLYPYLKPMSNKGLVLHCEEMQNVSLINCDRRVYSTCNFFCPDGFTPLSNTTTCNLLGPLKNVTVEWSNSGHLCAFDPVKDGSSSVMENTDHTPKVFVAVSVFPGALVLLIIALLAYFWRRKRRTKPRKDGKQVDPPQENPLQRDPPVYFDIGNMEPARVSLESERDIDLPQSAQVSQRNSQVEVENVPKGLPELPMHYDVHDAHQTDNDDKTVDEHLKRIVDEFDDDKLEFDKETFDKKDHGDGRPSTSLENVLSVDGRHYQAMGVYARAVPNLETAETAPLLEQSGQRLCIGPCVTSVNLFLKQPKSFVDSLSRYLETFKDRPRSQTICGFAEENLEKLKFKDFNDVQLFIKRCEKGYEVENFLYCMAGADVLIGDFLVYCNKHAIQNVIDIVLRVHRDCEYCHQYSRKEFLQNQPVSCH